MSALNNVASGFSAQKSPRGPERLGGASKKWYRTIQSDHDARVLEGLLERRTPRAQARAMNVARHVCWYTRAQVCGFRWRNATAINIYNSLFRREASGTTRTLRQDRCDCGLEVGRRRRRALTEMYAVH
ncbi:hypothetical protein MRX96_024405 [Rhipicephalus microplus]